MTPIEQKAQARKYDAQLVWLFAELEPGIWCLYSPDRRTPYCIGTLEAIIDAYQKRGPVRFTRVVTNPKAPKKIGSVEIKVNI